MADMVEVGGTCDLICNLKAAVTALECQHNMNLLKEQARKKSRKPASPPMFVMIPLEQQTNGNGVSDCEERTGRRGKNHHDYQTEYAESIASSHSATRSHHRGDGCNNNNGPGVRGGVLHSRCNCIHRDGLQDSCPLTECQNEPECMKRPWANCPPAKYFRKRFPENYP